MIKHLQKVGNSRGIVLDRPILELLHIGDNAAFEVTQEKNGLLLRPLSVTEAYRKVSQKHRKSLDKLAKPESWKREGQSKSNGRKSRGYTVKGTAAAGHILREDRPMKTHAEIRAILHAHAKELRRRYGLVNMAVFGSVVRDEAREGSDVDILTGFERPISLLTLVEAEYYLGDLLGVKVDLVPARSVRPELKERILGEAVPI
jgi:predicted nucleotidyltransferase/antitoxin component of MazEF toxin-antitoxin module